MSYGSLDIKPISEKSRDKDLKFFANNYDVAVPCLYPNTKLSKDTDKGKMVFERIGKKVLRVTLDHKIIYQRPFYFIVCSRCGNMRNKSLCENFANYLCGKYQYYR